MINNCNNDKSNQYCCTSENDVRSFHRNIEGGGWRRRMEEEDGRGEIVIMIIMIIVITFAAYPPLSLNWARYEVGHY